MRYLRYSVQIAGQQNKQLITKKCALDRIQTTQTR